MSKIAIIPARYASTRFPAKATAEILGKPMIQRVYEQVCKSEGFDEVLIATDHPQIEAKIKEFGAHYVLTSPDCPTGTARCYEAYKKLGKKYDFIVNIQGDEPFIAPQQIQTLLGVLDQNTQIATLAKKINEYEQVLNPNVVKVVFGQKQQALYFSRSPIPYQREKNIENPEFYKHIGIYAFHSETFEQIQTLAPSVLEKTEMLEQLTWLWAGFSVQIALTDIESYGIDTPEDVAKVLKIFAQ